MSVAISGVQITLPLGLNDANLIGTDVPETDYASYAGGTTYAKGARAVVPATHLVYESLQDSNTGHDPAASPTWWLLVGANNRWALVDGKVGTQTAKPGGFYYRWAPGAVISMVALSAMVDVQSIRLRMIDPVFGVVYDRTEDTGRRPRVANYYEYFLGSWLPGKRKLLFVDLPAYPDAELRLDVTGGSACAIGMLLIGQATMWGDGVYYGAKVGIRDYSQKTTDKWGTKDVVEGDYADRTSIELAVLNGEVDALAEHLASLRAKKVFAVFSAEMGVCQVYGFIDDWQVLVKYSTHSDCSLSFEGVT